MSHDYYNNYQGSQNQYDGYDDQYDGDAPEQNNHYANNVDDFEYSSTPLAKKVIRTIFYTTLMISSFLLVFIYIFLILKVAGKAGSIGAKFAQSIPLLGQISLYTFLGSVIFLIFTARQGIVIPVITLIFFIVMIFIIMFVYPLTNGIYQFLAGTEDKLFFAEYFGFPKVVEFSLQKLVKGLGNSVVKDKIGYAPIITNAAMLVSSIFITIYLSTRKPKSAATTIIGVGVILLSVLFFYNVVVDAIVLSKKVEIFKPGIFKWITMSMHGIKGFSFILFAFGSMFGIFAVKKD